MFKIQISRSFGCTIMRSLWGFQISSWAHSHTRFLRLLSSPQRIGSRHALLYFPDSSATPSHAQNPQCGMPVLHHFMQHSAEHVFALMTKKSGVAYTEERRQCDIWQKQMCCCAWIPLAGRIVIGWVRLAILSNSSVLSSVSQRNSRRIPGSNSL